jgi:hypothetical protein
MFVYIHKYQIAVPVAGVASVGAEGGGGATAVRKDGQRLPAAQSKPFSVTAGQVYSSVHLLY